MYWPDVGDITCEVTHDLKTSSITKHSCTLALSGARGWEVLVRNDYYSRPEMAWACTVGLLGRVKLTGSSEFKADTCLIVS